MSELVRCHGCYKERGLIPASEFGIRKDSGKLRTYCRACDRKKAAAWKAKVLADPERAAEYHKKQVQYKKVWLTRKGNKEKQAEYQKTYERSSSGKARASRARANQAWRDRNPAAAKAASRKWYDAMMADPKRHQEFLESRRIQYRLRKEREGLPPVKRNVEIELKHDPRMLVPAEPFVRWLAGTLKTTTYRDMGHATGVHEDKLRQIARGRYEMVQLATVDRVVTKLEGPPLRSLYPDL